MAIWVGNPDDGFTAGIQALREASKLQEFLFFYGHDFVGFANMQIRQLPCILFCTMIIVLGNIFALEQILEVMIGVPANIANGNLGVFTLMVNDFTEGNAAFFG